jgi:hypothetical protein
MNQAALAATMGALDNQSAQTDHQGEMDDILKELKNAVSELTA